MCSREFEERAVVGVNDVPPPSAQHQVAQGRWQVAGAIPVMRLGEDPLCALAAPCLESRQCLRDVAYVGVEQIAERFVGILLAPLGQFVGAPGLAHEPGSPVDVAFSEQLNSTHGPLSYSAEENRQLARELDAYLQSHERPPLLNVAISLAVGAPSAPELEARVEALVHRFGTNEAIRKFLLEEAGFAVLPFQAFGLKREDGWFRLSAGAVSVQDCVNGLKRVREALLALP